MWLVKYTCSRWAFIDLTAGPFSWGPAVGGEGVRTEYSLPNVTKTIGAVTGNYDNDSHDHSFLMHREGNHVLLIDVEMARFDLYNCVVYKQS